MHCGCGFLMQVRAGGGFCCSRCGNVEGAPARARKNRAAAWVTDQSSVPVEPEVSVPVAPAPEPELVVAGAPENDSQKVPRGMEPKPRPTFGRGGRK